MENTSEAITKLITDLQGEDESVRSLAAFALGLLGAPAVKPLTSLLGHEREDVRMRAAWVLGVIGGPALPELLAMAESENQRLRVEAIRILGVIGEARTLNHLLIALTDPDAEIAARSARAIGKIGDPRAFHPLVTALQIHPAADVRYEACRALADLHISEAIPLLQKVAQQDTGRTNWGAPVAEIARRAAEDLSTIEEKPLEEQFDRIRKLLEQHQASE